MILFQGGALANNLFGSVVCPAEDNTCGGEIVGMTYSHHSLVTGRCPKCGRVWRMFHSANSDTVEFTEIKEVASTDEAFIPVVHCNERRNRG